MKSFEVFIYSFLLVQIGFVAIGDIKHRKISNQWLWLNLALYIAFLFLFKDYYQFTPSTIFYSLTFFVVGVFCFWLKIMGAGDSKYLVSLFLLTPSTWQDQSFSLLVISTMIIGGFSFLTSLIQNYEKIVAYAKSGYVQGVRQCLGNKFPYAPVIFMSWIWLGFQIF
ncbi:MAG: prepilin peptidase [Halobacteriovoraceae bacterium]|nr:prepilin peptidase [Halobacteriovoraceae bacterium]